jgi:hypothetical protein
MNHLVNGAAVQFQQAGSLRLSVVVDGHHYPEASLRRCRQLCSGTEVADAVLRSVTTCHRIGGPRMNPTGTVSRQSRRTTMLGTYGLRLCSA